MSDILDENIKGYCHLCGAAIHVDMEEVDFCPYCGKRIKPDNRQRYPRRDHKGKTRPSLLRKLGSR